VDPVAIFQIRSVGRIDQDRRWTMIPSAMSDYRGSEPARHSAWMDGRRIEIRRDNALRLVSSANSSDSSVSVRPATEQDPVEKESKTDAELEDMILQRLLIGGVFVSVRRDPMLGWRPTVVTAPRHARNAQELADKIAAELRKKFTLKQ
jgi:hypothetical protein